jgi:hypothetical protein
VEVSNPFLQEHARSFSTAFLDSLALMVPLIPMLLDMDQLLRVVGDASRALKADQA